MRTLMKVQKEALRRSSGKRGFGFFMEQGLGKTITALEEFDRLFKAGTVKNMVVICPPHLLDVWVNEAKEWLGDRYKMVVWPERPNEKGTTQIFVSYYQMLMYEVYGIVERMLEASPCYFALDESQNVKNYTGVYTKRVLSLRALGKVRRALTGTPMSQNVMDLFPQLQFIGRLDGMNPYQFRGRFAKTGGYMGKQILGIKPGMEEELQDILDSCVFRALKKDWWDDCPDKKYETRSFTMTKAQLSAFNQMTHEFYTALGSGEVVAEMVITQQMKLQQISRGFAIDPDGKVLDVVPVKKNPAVEATRAAVEETDNKTLIATVHRHSTMMLAEALKDHNPAVMIGGKQAHNVEEKKRFNTDDSCRVMIGQQAVTGAGHTLLGTPDRPCYTELLFENTYDLIARSQFEDRIHRFGQHNACLYLDLVGAPTDHKVIKALQTKSDVVAAIVDAVRTTPLHRK